MSMTATMASILPTPPSSPLLAPSKPFAIQIASVVALRTKSPSQPTKDAPALSQPACTPAVNVTSTTNTRSTPQIPTSNPASRALTALEEDLCIDEGRCGAQTKKNTKCKRSIINHKKDLIDAQLASMKGLTCASPELESELLKLVMLVHCSQHDAGRPKDHRLEAWRLIFSSDNDSGSGFEVSVEQLVRKALEPFTIECIAHNNEVPCRERIGGWKVQNCERTLQELVKQEIYSDDAKLEFLLRVLEWNRSCKTHENSRRSTCTAAWKKSIMAVLPLPTHLGDRALTSNVRNKPQTSPSAQAGFLVAKTSSATEKGSLLTVQILPGPRAPQGSNIGQDADPALYWPKSYGSSPFIILAHADHGTSPTRSHKLIRDELIKILDPRDVRSGYVYAYEVEGNSGYIKIGYTTRSIKERHDEWSFDCNRKIKPLYPSLDQVAAAIPTAEDTVAAPAVLVPHPRRVEALCHAELDHHRIRIYCNACLKQHIEWFKISAMEATSIMQKWSRWMMTEPYEVRQLRAVSKWKLKEDEILRTLRLDQFMQEIAEASVPPQD